MTIITKIERKAHFSRYVFGSAVYSDSPDDIDVAIIYDKQYVSLEEALAYRKELIVKLGELNSMLIDTILLSKEEEKEMSFLLNSKHIEF